MGRNEKMSTTPRESMNTDRVEALLHSIRPEPGEAYHRRMAAALWVAPARQRAGAWMLKQRLALAAGCVLLLAIIVLLATPAGGVLAQSVLQFFTRVQGNIIPVPTEQMAAPASTRTPAPTHALGLLPADEIVTPTPALAPTWPAQEGGLQEMTLMAAEAAVGFDLYEPLDLPSDYRLTRIQYDPEQQAVHMMYASPKAAAGKFFVITQGKQLPSFEVGANATIETVSMGATSAEFVRGKWFAPAGSNQATWEDHSEIYTLGWQAEDVTIRIQFVLNDTFYPAYLDRDEMLAVGRSMTRCPATDDYACQLSQTAAALGFSPWELPTAPQGYEFLRTDYCPGQVTLWYGDGAQQLWILQSVQAFSGTDETVWTKAPKDSVLTASVGGLPAEYVRGQFLPATDGASAVWDGQAGVERLRWQDGGLWFQIAATGGAVYGPQGLTALAGQLAQSTRLPDVGETTTPTPEAGWAQAYSGITELEAAAGYNVLEPTVLPEGLAFSHARFEPHFRSIMLFYGSFAADLMHSNGPVLVVSQRPLTGNESFNDAWNDSGFPQEAIRDVVVNGYPGKIYLGSLTTGLYVEGQPTSTPAWTDEYGEIGLSWMTEEWEFSLHFSASSGARLAEADLIAIAESLR